VRRLAGIVVGISVVAAFVLFGSTLVYSFEVEPSVTQPFWPWIVTWLGFVGGTFALYLMTGD